MALHNDSLRGVAMRMRAPGSNPRALWCARMEMLKRFCKKWQQSAKRLPIGSKGEKSAHTHR